MSRSRAGRASRARRVASLAHPWFTHYLLRFDGRPATVARRATFEGASYLSSIGTAGWARGRGFGGLVTRLATADSLALGSEWTYLGRVRRQRGRGRRLRAIRVRAGGGVVSGPAARLIDGALAAARWTRDDRGGLGDRGNGPRCRLPRVRSAASRLPRSSLRRARRRSARAASWLAARCAAASRWSCSSLRRKGSWRPCSRATTRVRASPGSSRTDTAEIAAARPSPGPFGAERLLPAPPTDDLRRLLVSSSPGTIRG